MTSKERILKILGLLAVLAPNVGSGFFGWIKAVPTMVALVLQIQGWISDEIDQHEQAAKLAELNAAIKAARISKDPSKITEAFNGLKQQAAAAVDAKPKP